MKTIGLGAERKEPDNVDEFKKEIKTLKTLNTKMSNKLEELIAENEKLHGKIQELTAVTSHTEE